MQHLQKPDPSDPWRSSTGVSGYSREAYEGESQLLEEVEIFGWLRFREALVNALMPDRHPNALEIHYMRRGHLRWWAEADECEFSTGRVFIVQPGELHGASGGSIQPCEHYWVRVRIPSAGRALPQLTPKQTAEIVKGFKNLRSRTFAVTPQVNEFFETLHEEHRNPRGVASELMARSALHALLVTILRDSEAHHEETKRTTALTWQVQRAMDWLQANYREPDLKVDQLCQSFGRSSTALRSRFKQETGYTPHEYVLHRRIEEARRELLETDKDVTNIAHGLGFSSSQYFATVFRRQTGLTPSAFREQRGAK